MTLTPARTTLATIPPLADFLWGAATSAHQTEGDNRNSNWWHLEHSASSPFSEPSGDAVGSYRLFPTDMRLLAEAGLTAYRFSIEWSRIEPRRGQVDESQLAHYRRMIDTAISLGLTPVVTLHHFTTPQWFTELGGWRGPEAVPLFRKYVSTASRILEDVGWICTINEPNMVALAANLFTGEPAPDAPRLDNRAVTSFALPAPADDVSSTLADAHRAAVEELRGGTSAKLGWTVSNQVFEADPEHADIAEQLQWSWEDRFLEVSRDDDFVGVQAYTAHRVGETGVLPHPDDENSTQTGWPKRPDALEKALRHAWAVTRGVPMLVTEHGIATADDTERVTFTAEALAGLGRAMADGIDVRGYLHWSALDNYEWGNWEPTFGLIEVDRTSFERKPRPSLFWLGETARQHGASTSTVVVPPPAGSARSREVLS